MNNDLETARDCGATTYTNRHGLEDPYIAMSCKQFAVYTDRIRAEVEAAIAQPVQPKETP